MSTKLAMDRVRLFHRRVWRNTLWRRLAELPVLVSVAVAVGHAWGGWGSAAVAGGAMLALLTVSVVAEYASLVGAFGPEHGVRPAPRWTAFAAWAKCLPVVAALAACGYLWFGWGGAVSLGLLAMGAFGLAARAEWRIYRDAATAALPAQPKNAEPGISHQADHNEY